MHLRLQEALAHPFFARVRSAKRATNEDVATARFRVGCKLKRMTVVRQGFVGAMTRRALTRSWN